jgi:hypothetical protein
MVLPGLRLKCRAEGQKRAGYALQMSALELAVKMAVDTSEIT